MLVVDVPVQTREENETLAGENLSSTVAAPQEQQAPETHSEQVPVAEIPAEGSQLSQERQTNQADVGSTVEEKAKIGPVNCFACSRDSVRALFFKGFAKPRTA